MSRNEDLSQFDPTEPFPASKFDSFPIAASVQNNRLVIEHKDAAPQDLGDFKLASAVYIVGGYISPTGRAVVVLSDGNEAVLNKITNDRTYAVTLEGRGYFTGNDKSKLQFAPIETNFPMTFDGKTFNFAKSNRLRLDKYLRIDHIGPYPAGRTFTTWSPIPIGRVINNLNASIVGNIFTLPAGRYYVKIIGQHFRGIIGYMSLIDAASNLPIMREAISVSHTDGSGTQLLVNQQITLDAETQLYLGGKTSTAQTNTYGWGLGSAFDINHTWDLYNSVEIWRLND